MPVGALPAGGIYAITAASDSEERLLRDAESCLANGVSMLQYRDKSRNYHDRLKLASTLCRLCDRYGKPLIINDDLELALESMAAGIHLGKEDLDALPIARLASHEMLVGVSCYDSLQRARDAIAAGADYVAFGSVFESSTKRSANRCSLDLLHTARAEFSVPIVAIGGITPENGREVLHAGAHFLAVISGIFGQSDIAVAVHRYASLFT